MAWVINDEKDFIAQPEQKQPNWVLNKPEDFKPVTQSVMDAEDQKVYNVPVGMDGRDTQFAIDTQYKGKDKGGFFGKVWTAITGNTKATARGLVGSVEKFGDVAVTGAMDLEGERKKAAGKPYNQYAYANNPIVGWSSADWVMPDEEEQEMAKETVKNIEAIRKRNKDFWTPKKEAILPEKEMTKANRLFEGIGDAFGSVGATVATTAITKNPSVSAGFWAYTYGKIRENEYVDKALEQGMDVDLAYLYGEGAGIIEGGLELYGGKYISELSRVVPISKISKGISEEAVKLANTKLGKIGKSVLQKTGTRHATSTAGAIAKGFMAEGVVEEGLQQGLGMIYENATGVSMYSDEEIINDTLFSAFVGGIAGGTVAGTGTHIYNKRVKAVNQQMKDMLQKIEPEIKGEELQTRADALQELLYQNAPRYFNELNNVLRKETDIDVMPDGLTPDKLLSETRKILQEQYKMSDEEIDNLVNIAATFIDARTGFNESYNELYDQLTAEGIAPKVADRSARVYAAHILSWARKRGVSAEEARKRIGVKVAKQMWADYKNGVPADDNYAKRQQQIDDIMNVVPENWTEAQKKALRKGLAARARYGDLEAANFNAETAKQWFESKGAEESVKAINKRVQTIMGVLNAKEEVENVRKSKRINPQNVNPFEALVDDKLYKKVVKIEKENRGDSLITFIVKRGGLKDVGGELKNMDAQKQRIGLINNKSGNSFDDIALAAWEHGYFPAKTERPTIQDLLDAINDELFDKKHYQYQEGNTESVIDYVDSLAEQMDMLGIDYSGMSAEEAEAAYYKAAEEYSKNAKQAEPEYNDNGVNFDDDFTLFQLPAEAYKNGKADTNSEAFKQWFKNSKVVDRDGKPLSVYHGTREKFSIFKSTKILNSSEGVGFNFAVKKDIAEGFGEPMEVYLNLQNPVYAYSMLDLIGADEEYDGYFEEENQEAIREAVRKVKEQLEQKGYTFYDEVDSEFLPLFDNSSEAQEVLDGLLDFGGYIKEDYDPETLYNDIRQAEIDVFGVDGYVTERYGTDGGRVYIAFKPEQIKSVYNNGNFDINNPDINYQTGIKEIDDSTLYNALPQNLKDAVDFIYNGDSVYDITGDEFPNDGTNLNDRVYEYYKEKYNNKIELDNFGVVMLDKRGIKTSAIHGISNNKANAFVAVPEVLKNGKLVQTQENYKGKSENRYLFVAPVTVADKNGKKQDYFCEVVVKEGVSGDNNGKKRFYLHEIELKEKLTDSFTSEYDVAAVVSSKSIISSLINNFKQKAQKNGLLQETTGDGGQPPRGMYDRSKNIIYLFENYDASTIIHELGHYFLENMQKFADNEKTAEQLAAVYEYVGCKDGQLTREQHELFADSFEVYMMDGRAPNNTLRKVFNDFKEWLKDLFFEVRRIKDIKLDDNIRAVFDDMLGGKALDFAMQTSGIKMAQALERGNISGWQIDRAMQLVYQGKMSKAEMQGLINKLRGGMSSKEFVEALKEFENKPTKSNKEPLTEWDYTVLRNQLESLNFNRDKVKARVERLLKWGQPRTRGGKLVGRFPNKQLNAAFVRFYELATMESGEAKELVKKNLEMIEQQMKGGGDVDIEQLGFENMLLAYNLGNISNHQLLKLYNGLAESYNMGRLSANVTGEAKKERRRKMKERAIAVLTGNGAVNSHIERGKIKQALARWGTSQQAWSGLLDVLSMNDRTSQTNKSALSQDLDMFEAEQKKYAGVAADSDIISDKLSKALNGNMNIFKYMKNLDKKYTIEWVGTTNPKSYNQKEKKPVTFSKTFTKDQLLDIYMKTKDADTREIMVKDPVNQYNEQFLSKVDELIDENDKAVAEAIFGFYDENYKRFNAFYEEHYNWSLGKYKYYTPRAMSINGTVIDDNSNNGYVGFGGIKQRVAVAGTGVIDIQGAFKALNKYINKQNHFMGYMDKLTDINAVLGDTDVKNIIKNIWGEQLNTKIAEEINNLANNGNDKYDGILARLNRVRARYAQSVLAVKPSLAIKQLTSFPAYWENMSTVDFVAGVTDFLLHPKEAIKTLGNTTLMKTRGTDIIRDFDVLNNSSLYKQLKKTAKQVKARYKLTDIMMLNIQAGDRGAIYMGGWALYKSELKKNLASGMAEPEAKAQALAAFERITDETQQSGRLSQQSYMQNQQFWRMFTMFTSSQNQYLRKEINAIRGLATGRMDKVKAAKTIFIYHVLLPVFFQVVSDGFRWDKDNDLRAAVLGSLNGWFILNKVLENVYNWVTGNGNMFNTRMSVRDLVPFWGSAEDFIKDIYKWADDDIELSDYLDVLKPAGELTGLPLKYAKDVLENAGEYAADDEYFKEGLLWLGWSPYSLRDSDDE